MDLSVSIAPAADPADLEGELTPDKLVCRFRDIEIYVVTAAEAPAIMREIGRIREREYRNVGAGRNLPFDIDRFDTGPLPYRQLLAWDPVDREIIAMYRYFFCRDAVAAGDIGLLRTAGLFSFSQEFVRETLPVTVELGRSVVNQQARRAVLGLFSVWTGLGAIMVEHPEIHWFFGNVSVYRSWPNSALTLLLAYLLEYHQGAPGQVTAGTKPELPLEEVERRRQELFSGPDREEGYRLLLEKLGEHGLTPPPILISYLRSSRELRVYDSAEDPDFGGALEVAIAVSTKQISPKTRRRFVDSYVPVNGGAIR